MILRLCIVVFGPIIFVIVSRLVGKLLKKFVSFINDRTDEYFAGMLSVLIVAAVTGVIICAISWIKTGIWEG